jgi:L-threonylcarbamoyladenylate synthase
MSDWSEIQTALDAGEAVILPTETVYGLAARADMPSAVSKIYDIKGRDFDKPLAVCVKNIAQAKTLAHFDTLSQRFVERYWPGSLTLVLNLKEDTDLDPRVTSNIGGVRTIALRCPDAAWRASIEMPLALTSANRSGDPDCISHEDAIRELGSEIAASLSTEAPLSGAPSTVLRVENGKLTVFRQGDLKVEL